MDSFYTPPHTVEEVFLQKTSSIDWNLQAVSIETAWKYSRGKGVKVCVLDSGFVEHREVNVATFKDFTTEGSSPSSGHAIHVSGLIKGRTVGTAPECDLLVGKVLKTTGGGAIDSIIKGISWALDEKVDILSMSFGSFRYYKPVHDLLKTCFARNMILVAAAGNENTLGINFPAIFPECLSIGAVDKEGNVCDFSSRGYKLDVAAPGKDILSTYLDNSYASISGTSQATPIVAGILACWKGSKGLKNSENFSNLLTYRRVQNTAYMSSVNENTGFGIINTKKLYEI
jgi:subtilisin family serine protease